MTAAANVHVIGAGLAGLAAALTLSAAGRAVTLHEAGPAAGGRCRSFFDRGLGCRIDNGNHLLLSGNRAAMAFLDEVGARDTLTGPGEAFFHFMDLASRENWSLTPGPGRVPWWMLRKRTRIPGTRLRDYLGALRLRRAGAADTVHAVLGRTGELYRRLLEPLAVSALNTRADTALACLLLPIIAETLLLGGAFCIPSFPREGLSESFIDPAVTTLRARGARLRLGSRVAGLRLAADRVDALAFSDGDIMLAPGDGVVMAVPAWVAADLLPGLTTPNAHESILNIHYKVETTAPKSWSRAGFCGLIGGTAEWLFAKPGILSVTVSAANHLVDLPAEEIASRIWRDVRNVLGTEDPMPPVRVVKEKRATFAATAEQHARRPASRTDWVNLSLAGDWTATGLPATIEGAIRSGRKAAETLLAA